MQNKILIFVIFVFLAFGRVVFAVETGAEETAVMYTPLSFIYQIVDSVVGPILDSFKELLSLFGL